MACYLGLAVAGGLVAAALERTRAGAALASVAGAAVTLALWAAGVALTGAPLRANLATAALYVAALAASAWRAPGPRGGRRPLLRGVAVSTAGVMLMANVAFFDALRRAATGAGRGGARLFDWAPPPSRQPGFDLPGLSPEVTPPDAFYRMSKNVVDPNPDGDAWRLTVGGRQWRLADLLALPRVDVPCTLRCVSNRVDTHLMSTALFSGVRLRDLLAAAGVPAAGLDAWVVFVGLDGHADSIETEAALDPDTLVAYAMNGHALTRAHGYPARLLIPGRYGFKNVKWLSEIRVSPEPFAGTWQQLGWTRTAVMKTMSRIDVARREGAGAVVAGVAYAGVRGVRAVRVRFDDGPWRQATLHVPPFGPATWVQWRIATDGPARAVVVQAVDGTGAEQPSEERGQFPDGAQGLHRAVISDP
ncbi:MAG: molybdopterin-dependent oxidoreductase [Dehalococcoidia bacterium]